ncbi:MAG: N-acyl-D-amino-acid deacylase family protein [Clostridia bacterium]
MITVIQNVKIYDGSGKKPFMADLKFDEHIHQIDLPFSLEGENVIDGTNLVLSPGFIDTHSHNDLEAIKNPKLIHSISQGITTEVVGQDGSSVTPVDDECIEELMDNMAPLAGVVEKPYWWRDVKEYLEVVQESKPSLKIETLIGHGTVRLMVMGSEDRAPTKIELEKICRAIDENMQQGAKGVSMGLIYPPGSYAKTNELIEIAKVVAKYDGILMVHMRNEQDKIMTSIDEMEQVVRESGVRLHISHLKALGQKNWGNADRILERLNQLRKDGYKLTFDQYPYAATCTGLKVIVPTWAFSGGEKAFQDRLNSESYEKIKQETAQNIASRGGPDKIMIASVASSKNQWMSSKRLDEIAKEMKLSPEDAALQILKEEGPAVVAIYFSISEDDVKTIMQHKLHGICTDGIIGDHPHPRAYGSFPRVLGYFVNELNLLTMEEAISQMTFEAAYRLRIFDRGLIREGLKADLVLFDPKEINSTNSYINPKKLSVGIEKVFVNGVERYNSEMRDKYELSN